MTRDKGILSTKSSYSSFDYVQIGNGLLIPIKSVGNVCLRTPSRPLSLESILHVLDLKHNLLSVCRLCWDNNCHVQFSESSFFVKDNIINEVLLQDSTHGNLYPVRVSTLQQVPAFSAIRDSGGVASTAWSLWQ